MQPSSLQGEAPPSAFAQNPHGVKVFWPLLKAEQAPPLEDSLLIGWFLEEQSPRYAHATAALTSSLQHGIPPANFPVLNYLNVVVAAFVPWHPGIKAHDLNILLGHAKMPQAFEDDIYKSVEVVGILSVGSGNSQARKGCRNGAARFGDAADPGEHMTSVADESVCINTQSIRREAWLQRHLPLKSRDQRRSGRLGHWVEFRAGDKSMAAKGSAVQRWPMIETLLRWRTDLTMEEAEAIATAGSIAADELQLADPVFVDGVCDFIFYKNPLDAFYYSSSTSDTVELLRYVARDAAACKESKPGAPDKPHRKRSYPATDLDDDDDEPFEVLLRQLNVSSYVSAAIARWSGPVSSSLAREISSRDIAVGRRTLSSAPFVSGTTSQTQPVVTASIRTGVSRSRRSSRGNIVATSRSANTVLQSEVMFGRETAPTCNRNDLNSSAHMLFPTKHKGIIGGQAAPGCAVNSCATAAVTGQAGSCHRRSFDEFTMLDGSSVGVGCAAAGGTATGNSAGPTKQTANPVSPEGRAVPSPWTWSSRLSRFVVMFGTRIILPLCGLLALISVPFHLLFNQLFEVRGHQPFSLFLSQCGLRARLCVQWGAIWFRIRDLRRNYDEALLALSASESEDLGASPRSGAPFSPSSVDGTSPANRRTAATFSRHLYVDDDNLSAPSLPPSGRILARDTVVPDNLARSAGTRTPARRTNKKFQNTTVASLRLRLGYHMVLMSSMTLLWVDLVFGWLIAWLLFKHPGAVLAVLHKGYNFLHIDVLRAQVDWLTGFPAGLKLNDRLSTFVGFILYSVIDTWNELTTLLAPMEPMILKIVAFTSLFGASFVLGITLDILAFCTLHVFYIYVFVSQLTHVSLPALRSLWYLFRGRKWNVLRKRVDSCSYKTDQHLLGAMSFTCLLFLLPTFLVFYLSFVSTWLIIVCTQLILQFMLAVLNHFPSYLLMLKVTGGSGLPSGVSLRPLLVTGEAEDDDCNYITSYWLLDANTASIQDSVWRPFASGLRLHFASFNPINILLSVLTGRIVHLHGVPFFETLVDMLPFLKAHHLSCGQTADSNGIGSGPDRIKLPAVSNEMRPQWDREASPSLPKVSNEMEPPDSGNRSGHGPQKNESASHAQRGCSPFILGDFLVPRFAEFFQLLIGTSIGFPMRPILIEELMVKRSTVASSPY